ncbi:MAG: Dabb family protein [Oscillospiraceae bacterium]|jgi:heme-degrading monooxygenase HmoA|nr:Dabb family protein [Oscillospiraceae bacterium]
MTRHLVFWNFKESLTPEEREEYGRQIQENLEALQNKIDGILSIKVYRKGLASSNRDLALNSLFENEAALQNYQTHPEHLKAADIVRSVTQDRVCIDYEETD